MPGARTAAVAPLSEHAGPRISRAEQMANALAAEIEQNSLRPGDHLGTKDQLRNRFRVAVATVNEALRVLSIRGLVVARPGPGGGVFVTAPPREPLAGSLIVEADAGATPAEWGEIYDCLAPTVFRTAARRAGSRDAAALREIIASMSDALDDPPTFVRLHWQLHRRLAELGNNPPLTSLYVQLLAILERATSEQIATDPAEQLPTTLAVHRDLVEAIIDGNPKVLERAIRRHMPTSGPS